jgi:hypothetical protein
MYRRLEALRKSATFNIGETFTLLLPEHGLLSSLLLHITGTPVTDSMNAIEKWRMLDWISKIEVIGNGSTIIKSFTGRVAQYLNFKDGGLASPDKHFNYGSSTKRFHVPINFGRYLGDLLYGLDLTPWKSVELKLTNDGSGTYFTGNLAASIFALWVHDPPAGAFQKYFRTEEWRSIATVQAKTEYLDLPEEGKLRRLILQVDPAVETTKEAKTTLYNVVSNLKLTKKTGADILFDSSLRDLWYWEAFRDGRQILQPLEPYHTTAYGVRTGLGQTLGEAGLRMGQSGAQNTYGTGIYPGDDSSTLRRGVGTDPTQDALLVMGLALENCAAFDFNDPDEESTYLDLKDEGTVQLQMATADAASAAGGTVRLMLDRPMSPPI